MNLSDNDLSALSQLACETVASAGALIAYYANKTYEVSLKKSGHHLASQVVTEVDYKAEHLILECLQGSINTYDLAVLTEEQADSGERLHKDYFWCIDPIDGTLAFTESRPGYAVSVALVSQTGVPVIGAVYDPVSSVLYSAQKGGGVYRNGRPISQPDRQERKTLMLSCDDSLLKNSRYLSFLQQFEHWSKEEGYEAVKVVSGGGAVMNACHLLDHVPGCYFKPPKPQEGGGCAWDFAASACLFREMNWHVSDFSGMPLQLNTPGDTYMNHCGVFYTSHPELCRVVRDIWLD